MRIKWIAVLLSAFLALAAVFTVPAAVKADFGDFGGDTDYGGGWDDGGWDDWYDDDDWDWDDDDHYYYGGGSSGSGGYGGDGLDMSSIVSSMFFSVFMVIFFFVIFSKATRNRRGRYTRPAPQVHSRADFPPPGVGESLAALTQADPAFSPEQLKQRLTNLYMQMQDGWCAKDISSLRNDFTAEQFAQYDRQLDQYRTGGQTTHMPRKAVLCVDLTGYRRDGGLDVITARLQARITSYITDDRTGNIVSGSPTDEKFMTYEWTLVRPAGSQTQTAQADRAYNCPHCGGVMDINQSAQCPYCGTLVSRVQYDWVIANIRGVSQQTRR